MTANREYLLPGTSYNANVSLMDDAADDGIAAAAETANVGFTDPEAGLRTVAVSDTANHQVVVNGAGNDNHSTDLVTAGHNAGTTANVASLDTNNSSNPTLSVNATNPADVTFTVSGLENGYSGTVTFTDVSGGQDVVPVASNGEYSVNLSNLTNGTVTYLLSVSNSAGNVINVDPSITLGDGSANAPAGTAQFQNLLSGYAVRPSWNVAGVDYAVGVPQGTALQDPVVNGVLNPALVALGGSLDGSNIIIFSGVNNITISGWNFAENGGYTTFIEANNVTIEDCNYEVGSGGRNFIDTSLGNYSGLTIQYNTFNGNYTAADNSLLYLGAAGTTLMQYNLFENAYETPIEVAPSPLGGSTQIIQYNAIANVGYGADASGLHVDWVQDASWTQESRLFRTFKSIPTPSSKTTPRLTGPPKGCLFYPPQATPQRRCKRASQTTPSL